MKILKSYMFSRNSLIFSIVAFLLGNLSGCAINYKDVPDYTQPSSKYVVTEKVFYKINKLPVFTSGGLDAIDEAFRDSKVFRNMEAYYEADIPKSGIYIQVDTEYKAPDMPAVVFGYASVATLTLLPAWSNNDGFNIFYRIYVDGVLVKTLPYESRRFIAAWIVLLPFAWVNFMTNDEEEAFYAITYGFIKDAQPYLRRTMSN